MKKWKIFLILFLFLSLGGCAEQKLLENISLTTLVGYDLGTEENVLTTAVIRQVNPAFQSSIEIISDENQTARGSRAKSNRKSSKKILDGQKRVVLFGEELAKDGIGHYIETLSRNSSISNGLFMAVVDGEAKSLLNYQFENIEDIGEHIFKLLEQNIEHEQIISSTLHEVSHDYYSPGRDNVMPIIKRDEEHINISGIALYKKDKMVGELPAEDSFYLKIIRKGFDSGTFEIIINSDDLPSSLMNNPPDEIPVVFDTIKSKKELKLVNKTTPEFDLNISINARLLEIKGDIDLGEPKNITKLEKAISKSMSNEISRVISYCQEVNSDVFGFGEKYRSSVRQSKLTDEKWHEMFKDAKVNVKVDFKMLRSGVFD